jgi:DNA-binding FadR family transcriptional regulator
VLTAPQQVAAAIKQDILDGTVKPGDRLPAEQELASLFGVSRPTVRTALQELCQNQILTVRRGRTGGYSVGSLSLDALETSVREYLSLFLVVETLAPEHFFEVRAAHEVLCAEVAAARCDAAGLARLEEIHATLAGSTDVHGHTNGTPLDLPLDGRRAFELDLDFHRALAQATGNPLIVSFEGALIAVLHRLVGTGDSVTPTEAVGYVADVIAAVRAKDPAAARDAMRRHLAYSAAHYGLGPLDAHARVERGGARGGAVIAFDQ